MVVRMHRPFLSMAAWLGGARFSTALEGTEYVALVHPDERDEGRRRMLALLGSEVPSVDLDRLYRRPDHT